MFFSAPASENPTIIRLPVVKARTGLSRSSIYLKVIDKSFPPPINLGARSVGWLECEVSAWINDRVRESRRGSAQAEERQ
jgi:prophage regulatory protein